jgi:HAD superfamily hydrolase (TIGR01549 family)
MIKAIIFDYDGVISESVDIKTKAFAELYKPYGEDVVNKVVKHHLHNGGISRFEKFKIYHKEFLGIELTSQDLLILTDRFSQMVVDEVVKSPFVKGAIEFVSSNYKKYDLFISTGTPQTEIIEILRKNNILQYFIEVYGSPTLKPEHIRIILSKFNYLKSNVVFIGDAITDKLAANECDVHFIGRQVEGHSLGHLEHPVYDLSSISEVIGALK